MPARLPVHPRRSVAAAVLAAGLLVTGCGGAASPSTSSGSAVATSPTPSTGGSAATPAVRVVALTVAGGKVSGDTGRVVVATGTRVDVAVTADVAQEVHIHGYDLMVDTVPGSTVHRTFTASIPGVFVIELEQSRRELARLQVQ